MISSNLSCPYLPLRCNIRIHNHTRRRKAICASDETKEYIKPETTLHAVNQRLSTLHCPDMSLTRDCRR